MNRIIISSVVAIVAGFISIETSAQSNTSGNDSIVTAVKLNSLHIKKDKLEKEIKVEDSKRNSQIAGVSPETLEAMNNRQDSICLALRSELVDVILEIKELSPDVATPQLLQQYNNLVNKKNENPDKTEGNAQSVTTSNPAKKSEN